MMNLLHNFFVKPFSAKGFWWGLTDVVIKALTVVIWLWVFFTQLSLIWQSIRTDYNPLTLLWWFSFAFLMIFGSSLLAYILLFVRDYNETYEGEDSEEE